MKTFGIAMLASCASLLFFSACGSDNPVNRVENHITCKDVCQRYSDCYDKSYDVDGCTDRCTNDSTETSQKDDELDTCNDCIGDKSCVSATFNCADECSPFLP